MTNRFEKMVDRLHCRVTPDTRDSQRYDILDAEDALVSDELRTVGDTYRGMRFAGLVKVMDDCGFEHIVACDTSNGAIHLFGDPDRAFVVSADIADGTVQSVTLQYRCLWHPTIRMKCQLFHIEHGTKNRGWSHHVVVDVTNGFRAKTEAIGNPQDMETRWSNVDFNGVRQTRFWYSHLQIANLSYMVVPGLVSSSDGMVDNLARMGESLSAFFDARASGDTSVTMVGYQEANERNRKIAEMQMARLDAVPPDWRNILDLDFARKPSPHYL